MSEAFEHYLGDGSRRGPTIAGGLDGAAGGAPCGDLIRISLRLADGRVAEARFDAAGCSAAIAAGAAAAEAAEGRTVLGAARLASGEIADTLGGLSPLGRHGADLATDALHRALTAAIASDGPLRPPGDDPSGRVLVAMSGGVDSAVAAWLERERGADVAAVTVKLWADRGTDGTRSCCSPEAVLGARALAHSLGIPHLTMDLEREFRDIVVDHFLAGHSEGRTPNPCVRCNGGVRLDAMSDLADRLGADGLATGHYARVADDGEGALLVPAADRAKDQTYMLSAVSPRTLARLRFPLAELTKADVRRIAADARLPVASKRESQDLCFLAGQGKRAFLARHAGLAEREGEIVDRAGRVLGGHRGHHGFTVGQRRGLGLATSEPMYVLETDAATNRVVVGTRDELETSRVVVRDAVLRREGDRVDGVRLRYHSAPLRCTVHNGGSRVRAGRHPELVVRLEEPAAGVASGQTASLLDGEAVVGHATIA
ncbi:MAG TPA: tRNA 2-thiouridine(34) synthase MnmA [Solirubrobacterales bacterium]|nr:tRNA 2-thiouridine(34) synthase MnmA [Solirubrobacterales bacterium]